MSFLRRHRGLIRGLALSLALLAVPAMAGTQDHPLRPADRSSPRAALQTFLDSTDALASFLGGEYFDNPSRDTFMELLELAAIPLESLDVSEIPPAARTKSARAAVLALYEVLNRISLPPFEAIPDARALALPSGETLTRWVIPNTEITLVRIQEGPQVGSFLFSAETVARADEFYQRTQTLPYARAIPVENVSEVVISGGAWMIPLARIQALPAALRLPILQQSVWKWIGLVVVLGVMGLFLAFAYRLSRLGSTTRPFWRAVAQLAMPAAVLAAVPATAYLLLVQVNLIGDLAVAIELTVIATIYLAAAWMAWRFSSAAAELIIASPDIAPQSIDAHLIRLGARLLGIASSVTLLVVGAGELGLPVYGVVAGLGVGGLALALAAQPTIENLIGGMNLFADRPVRIGDFCEYGDRKGTIESIGIRSARIRGVDRTLTTIPNAVLAKMPIVNLTRRDRMLINAIVSLRYETTPEQLRYVLEKLRQLLQSHPRVVPEQLRVCFVGFGDSALSVELFAYVATSDWQEFLGLREEILFDVMAVIEDSGTSFAFPSHTVYLGRDRAPDEGRSQEVEANLQAWLAEGSPSSPDLPP